jgi:hypothetical protein
MPQYYFHLRDHKERLLDPQGRTIDSPDKIPQVALAEVRGMLSQDILTGRLDLRQRLEVEDKHGKVVYSLCFGDAIKIINGGPGRRL